MKWDLVSLENVERIEILRGKGGLEYGDDASAGVILISTRKIGSLSGNVKIYGGNHQNAKTYFNDGEKHNTDSGTGLDKTLQADDILSPPLTWLVGGNWPLTEGVRVHMSGDGGPESGLSDYKKNKLDLHYDYG